MFENIANLNDTIKAYDFEPREGVSEKFLIGRVIDKGFAAAVGTQCYTVEVTDQSDDFYQIGEVMYVPFSVMFDYNDRIQVIG